MWSSQQGAKVSALQALELAQERGLDAKLSHGSVLKEPGHPSGQGPRPNFSTSRARLNSGLSVWGRSSINWEKT